MLHALARLISVEIFRDGGSYEARFETEDGSLVALWLQRSAMPDAAGLHHRELFVHDDRQPVAGPQPLTTGSREEQDLLHRLSAFVVSQADRSGDTGVLARLRQMIAYIERREPVFGGAQPARRPPSGWPF
ncbi:hypothetical protein [Bradyrhizobium sp. SZCCHNRI1009]|uniref:hypothetical protein n=1 Tax=Bradyrhizobium sp. SZCCHNRI1009 TaxID=3057277 RepID=UPI00291681F3|nr:hypothetical protein [Bradyrhizobium sp. SZCCHNRI1009]